MPTNSFKTQWKYLLKEWDLTQDQLAINLNVDASLISKWVNGREPIPDWAKQKIQERFDLNDQAAKDLFALLEQESNPHHDRDQTPMKSNRLFDIRPSDRPDAYFLFRLLKDYEGNLERFFDPGTGAVREHASNDGSSPILYSVVTGYAIHDLLLLYKITGNVKYLDKAKRAGNWLVNFARNESSWVRHSTEGNQFFAFDNGICLSGFIDLYQMTHDELIYQRAHSLADNFVKSVREDGSISAVFDAQEQEAQFEQPHWSQQSGSFHTKIAAALVDMTSITKNEAYTERARIMCQYAMKFQAEDGRFITDEEGGTQLHAHCHSAEGLFHVGQALSEPAFVASAYRATVWALNHLRDDQISQEIGSGDSASWQQRTDTLAQVLSLGARFQQLGMLEESPMRLLEKLMNSLLYRKDPDLKFFQDKTDDNGQVTTIVSYQTNMFVFHALLEYLAAWVCRNSVVVIMAGGLGSRCWPISCENMPKPLSKGFLGERSLLEETVRRFLRTGCVLPENILVVVSRMGLNEAKSQLESMQIPTENIVQEPSPQGTLGALRLVRKILGAKAKAITIVSMSDNLIEPIVAVRDVLIRAVLTILSSEQDIIVSLGIPTNTQDSRYGHAMYRLADEIIPQVYRINRFIEKPQKSLHLSEGELLAWADGCIVTTSNYLRELLGKPHDQKLEDREDISYKLLENPQIYKGVSIFPQTTRFMDFGVPDHNLRQFFIGSASDKENGNVAFGPDGSVAVFLNAMRNLIISDRLSVEVIGISDHLIIDNSFANSAVVMPLDKVNILPTLYRMLENSDVLHPYITGGESAWNALPYHTTYECPEHCDVRSSQGLVLAAYCSNLKIYRGETVLRVADASFTKLTEDDIDILLNKKSDPRLVQHLIDVTVIAEQLAELVSLSPEGKELLHKVCLLHDYGGFLDNKHLQAEKEIIAMMQKVSGLDWRVIDPQVMKKLVLTGSDISLTDIQQQVWEKFNDSINSAIEALDIPSIRSYTYLDELLFCLCNHDRLDLFRPPFTSKFRISQDELGSIISCCLVADAWAKTHSMWKYQLRAHSSAQPKEDLGKTAAVICNQLNRAGIDPAKWIRHLNRLMLDERSPLFYYTCNKLRFVVKEQGIVEQVPLFGSDHVYLAFISCDKVSRLLDDKVKRAIELTLAHAERFDKVLLLWLPSNLSVLAEYDIVNRNLVEDLAQEVMSQFRREETDLWEREKKARASLLQVLNK